MQVISVNNNYSSALRRLAAFFIDEIVISIIASILFRFSFGWTWEDYGMFDYSDYGWHTHLLHGGAQQLLVIIYYALMESSQYQATIGKIVVGIKVTGLNGERINLAKALLRNLSKILSSIVFCIGYIMIIFDSRKQGLHDKIADTLVVRQ